MLTTQKIVFEKYLTTIKLNGANTNSCEQTCHNQMQTIIIKTNRFIFWANKTLDTSKGTLYAIFSAKLLRPSVFSICT